MVQRQRNAHAARHRGGHRLPQAKPEVVTAQIHGGDDDVMQIRLEGNRLMVQYADGAKQITLDPDYRLGTPFDIEIVAAANNVRVSYNGEPSKPTLPLSGDTWYFKAGAYVQSNPDEGRREPPPKARCHLRAGRRPHD